MPRPILLAAAFFAGPCVSAAHAEPWDGGIFGVSAGYDRIADRSSAISAVALPVGPVVVDTDTGEGASLGGVAGYRAQLGKVVLGGEADAAWSSAKTAFAGTTGSRTTKTEWQGSLRALAGVPAGNLLIFATGGVSAAHLSHSASFVPGGPLLQWSRTPAGWTAGAGIELTAGKFHPRLEFRHADYGTTATQVNATIAARRQVKSDSIRLTAMIAF